MFLALFVYAKFTTLGDTQSYISGQAYNYSDYVFFNSTNIITLLAHNFAKFFGQVGANFPFVLLSFFGIYYAVKRLALSNRELFFLLALLSLPSFGIWTSIASKEAMSVFFMGIILGFLIDIIKQNPIKNYLLVGFAFYLCAVFKPQYLIGIFSLLIFLCVYRIFSLRAVGQLVLLGLFFFCSCTALYIFRHQINELSFMIPAHFSMEAGSTRENTIWVNDFDVFWNAPYGMFIGFMGPTISEALTKPAHFLAFLESLFILAIFLYALLRLLFISVNIGRFNIFYVSVFLIPALWILFVHYPFGALNPGSAIRYRENFYAFLVILIYFGYIEEKRKYFYYKSRKQSE